MALLKLDTAIQRYLADIQAAALAGTDAIIAEVDRIMSMLDTDERAGAFVVGFERADFRRAFQTQLIARVAPGILERAEKVGIDQAARLTGVRKRVKSTLTGAFKAKQVRAMEVQFGGSMRQTSEQIRQLFNSVQLEGRSGFSVVEQLRNDLRTGGPIFKPMTGGRQWLDHVSRMTQQSSDRSAANGSVQLLAPGTVSAIEADEEMLNALHRWVSVLSENTCDPCKGRHDQVATWEQWDEDGRPGTDWNGTCRSRCNCQLVPLEARAESTEGPVSVRPLSQDEVQELEAFEEFEEDEDFDEDEGPPERFVPDFDDDFDEDDEFREFER